MCENLKTKGAFALFCKKRKAVLSVEAALVIPLFLITMIMLMSITSIYYVNSKIEAAVCEEAKYIALIKFDGESYSIGALQADIESKLGGKLLDSGLIKNGRGGINYSDSDLTNEEIVFLSLKYTIKVPFDLFSVFEIPFEKNVYMHSWIGYINGLNGLSSDNEYVYVTKNGTVYHRSRECSHIRLSIHSIEGSRIKELKNNSGGKYKKCVYCKPKITNSKLYITEDGDRYHKSLSCSGLKRTVLRVKKSKIGNMSPCTRCGY